MPCCAWHSAAISTSPTQTLTRDNCLCYAPPTSALRNLPGWRLSMGFTVSFDAMPLDLMIR
uniref:Uncharacterized protein n=1 Tax=Rhizophora mucronata TaxID=61149 RepID=A0A2P2JDN7_RHIMU